MNAQKRPPRPPRARDDSQHTSPGASRKASQIDSQIDSQIGSQIGSESGSESDSPTDPDQQPTSLDECRRCALWRNATQGVPGAGPRHAPIMMVGEQPGDSEDREGKPFVGPAGRLLDNALQQAGVARDQVFITNAVKHFKWEPRGKRRMHKTPAQREVEACRYWLDQELADVAPQVVIALGSTALKALLDNPRAKLQDYFGGVTEHGGRTIVATWHPSYALRAPDSETRERAYADIVAALARAQAVLAGSKPGKAGKQGR